MPMCRCDPSHHIYKASLFTEKKNLIWFLIFQEKIMTVFNLLDNISIIII